MKWRWLILIAIYAGLVIGGWFAGDWLVQFSAFDLKPQNESMIHKMIMTATGTFIVASATPFVPGAEIGFGLILLLGAKIAALVYVAMVAALLLSYLVGRFVPPSFIAAIFGFLGLQKAQNLALRLAPLGPIERSDVLTAAAPRKFIRALLQHRYLTLFVLLNLPGNSVVGGGGGIAFTAGMSGLYPLPAYIATILAAVAPVPLTFVIAAKFA